MHRLLTALALVLLVACQPATPPAGEGEGAADPVAAELVQPGKLRVAVEYGYQPFEMKNLKGEPIGFDVELAGELARRLGLELELVSTEWDNIIPSLLAKNVDAIISGMSITEERKRRIAFSEPYYKVGQAVLLQKKHEGKITSVADLNAEGMVVTTQNGTTGHAAAQKSCPKATIKPYDKQTQAALEVAGGRADAMIFDHPFVAIFALRNKETCAALLEPFTTEDIGVALRKTTPALKAAIDAALGAMREDGTHAKLVQKYFVDMPWLADVPK